VFGWLREKRMIKRRASIEGALLEQACVSLRGGSRFQFRVEEIGGEDQIRRFIVKLSTMLDGHVRANCGHGLVTVYDDAKPDGTAVVVATIKHGPSTQ
jgi:hypothetical protein